MLNTKQREEAKALTPVKMWIDDKEVDFYSEIIEVKGKILVNFYPIQ